MCGRYTLYHRAGELAKRYHVATDNMPIEPNYNAAPGQLMPVITAEQSGDRRLQLMQWGLIPFWAKDPRIGYKLINARDDTVFDKPAWRSIILHKRCLVPADGFYEWQQTDKDSKEHKLDLRKIALPSVLPASNSEDRLSGGGGAVAPSTRENRLMNTDGEPEVVGVLRKLSKQPFYIYPKQSGIFSFAGVWESWQDPSGLIRNTFSIITTEPNKEMAAIHNRMPVLLHQEDESAWLEPSRQSRDDIEPLLRPYEDQGLVLYKVSQNVNSPQHNNKSLIYALKD